MAELYGLIFDVDGVIADTESVNARASIRVFEELFGVKGVVREDFEAGLGRGAHEYVQAAAAVHRLELTDEQLEQATKLRQQYFLEVVQSESLSAFDGVVELMAQALADKNFKPAIATSGTREKSEAVLRSVNIPFEKMVYITGSDVEKKKPDPQLFLLAAERMGIEPARCVVIEDAPNGVQAAKSAGSACIAVTNSTTADRLSRADLVCDSLSQINLDTIITLIEK